MRKIAVVLYGPPGSGKGTQANLLSGRAGVIHFDTGRFLEALLHDPRRQSDPHIIRERSLFDSGKLVTPQFVTKHVGAEIRSIAKTGYGMVFSGSPRTIFEAEKILPLLERVYGKERIFLFILGVPSRISMSRNGTRFLCKICGAPYLTKYAPKIPDKQKHCFVCGGPLYRRVVDNPEIIEVRLREYKNRTEPIFAYAKKMEYRIVKVSATPPPYKVFGNILRTLAPYL